MTKDEEIEMLKAQLAEAVGLLRQIDGGEPLLDCSTAKALETFLARTAQAEQHEARHHFNPSEGSRDTADQMAAVMLLHGSEGQKAQALEYAARSGFRAVSSQEAQGAQAGDERAAFEQAHARCNLRRRGDGLYENTTVEGYWSAWQKRAALATQPAAGTTSDQYRAELYDEVWQKARDMGYGNVTDALVALERMKATQPAAGEPVAMQARMPGCRWENYHKDDRAELVASGMEIRWLFAAPPAAAPVAAGEPIGWLRLEPDDNETASYHFYQHAVEGSAPVCFVNTQSAAAHGDEAVRKDAARYQWLRSKSSGLALTVVANHSGTDLDSEIDAAMRAQGDREV